MGFTEIAIALAGLTLSYLAFKRREVATPLEARNFLVHKFDMASDQTKMLLDLMTQYSDKHDAYNDEFMDGFSFRQVISLLKTAQKNVFTSVHRKILVTSNASSIALEDVIKDITEAQKQVSTMLAHFNLYFGDQ